MPAFIISLSPPLSLSIYLYVYIYIYIYIYIKEKVLDIGDRAYVV